VGWRNSDTALEVARRTSMSTPLEKAVPYKL
jgi:hypothetical protein